MTRGRFVAVLLLLTGLSGCVMYGRAGGPEGQPYRYGAAALPPGQNPPPAQNPGQ
ncbi:hypothetical protein [Acidocella sp.]|uniref:hypothetical protein n=1 Tax=Acidocella sp. TaxID=50710 RepID=UPI003D0860C6